MFSTWMSPAAGWRRSFTGLVLTLAALAVFAAPVFAQDQTPAQAAPPPPPMTMGPDGGLIFYQVKGDKTADFENVLAKVKEALSMSEDPIRKQQAAGWKMFKQDPALPDGSVLYIAIIDPPAKDADYKLVPILAAAFPNEARALYDLYVGSIQGGVQGRNLVLVSAFGK